MQHFYEQPRFGFKLLLLGLVGLLIVPAFFEFTDGGYWGGIMLSAIMFSALYLVAYQLKELIILGGLIVPSLLLIWWPELAGDWQKYLGNALYLAALCFVAVLIMRYLFETNKVSMDMMFGALCLYLLIGLIWAFVYSLIEAAQPGSFHINGENIQQLSNRELLAYFAYYSNVTLSTLGYGDITPVSRMARSWAALEALLGQFYLAIVMARIVALYITDKAQR